MKRHVQQPGIRKWAAEDLLELQSEPLKALDGFFEEYGPCIIKGCSIIDNEDDTYNISAGLVALKGTDVAGNVTFKVVPFSGIENCPLPVFFTLSYSVVEREYADGKVKPIAYDYRAAVTAIKPEDVYYLELSLDNVPRFVDVIQNSEHRFMTDTEREKLKGVAEGANKYVHPETEGYKHIPKGGEKGQILRCSEPGNAKWSEDVYDWAKQPEKPEYTADEVGALPEDGNAASATKLANARKINGVDFNGTKDITITAAANGGNSNTVEGKNLDSLFVTNKGSINIDSTGSSWSNTYSPDSEGTPPVPNTYGTILQVSNHPHTAPGNSGIYPFQIGFSTDNSISFRSRFDNTTWTAWRKFILEGDKWGSIGKYTSGWYKNDSGLIVQWGYIYMGNAEGSQFFTITFPISFTSLDYQLVGIPVTHIQDTEDNFLQRSATYKVGFNGVNTSKSSIRGYIVCDKAYGAGVKWLAIGY